MTKSFVRKGINLIRQFFRSEADMTLQVETTLSNATKLSF